MIGFIIEILFWGLLARKRTALSTVIGITAIVLVVLVITVIQQSQYVH